jgi:hypothetical protein
MARTKRTAHKSTRGRAPRHQLAPREPRPEPTEVERLRAKLAEVTAARNAVQQQLEQVIHDRDQETLAVQVDCGKPQLSVHAGPRDEPAG